MLRRKLRESLTVRIFLITCGILLSAAAVTFGLIAWATPITYTAVVTDDLTVKTVDLIRVLERINLEDCGDVIDTFIRENGVQLMFTDGQGNVVQTPSLLAVQELHEDDYSMVVTMGNGHDTDTADLITSYYLSNTQVYDLSFLDSSEVYWLYISHSIRLANQAVEALAKVAPWLFLVMIAFSALCAFFYSRYITRPIVRLSGISQKMADLDFSWSCGGDRSDEIGTLGRNLDTLSQKLGTALDELHTANEALRQDIDRERELEKRRLAFFSAVSHELKTPVTILKGQLTGMLDGVDVYQDRDKYLARSLQVTARMEGLVQEILTVSRMESADFELCRQALDLSALVERQLALDADMIEQRALKLRAALPEGIVVSADEKLLQKAIGNILSNAFLYSAEGAEVCIFVRCEEGHVTLIVENGGVQIPDDAIPRLFDAFYRVEQSRNRSTGGSGLGLYIVKMILDRHDAQYRIENTADGARFTIWFRA